MDFLSDRIRTAMRGKLPQGQRLLGVGVLHTGNVFGYIFTLQRGLVGVLFRLIIPTVRWFGAVTDSHIVLIPCDRMSLNPIPAQGFAVPISEVRLEKRRITFKRPGTHTLMDLRIANHSEMRTGFHPDDFPDLLLERKAQAVRIPKVEG